MWIINQLQLDNNYLQDQLLACESTMQGWVVDHKRMTMENQDLRRELNVRENQWMIRAEAAEGWMDQMEVKQKQQDDKSKILEAELIMKDEMLARMMEEMSIQKQETEKLAMQNHSMMMIMQAQEEEEVKREADEREESKDELKNAHEQLKRSEEARGALKVEMKKLKEMLLEREGEQRKSAQYSITGTENLKKLREKITRESQRIREKMEARRKQSIASQSTEGTKSKSIMTMKNTSE